MTHPLSFLGAVIFPGFLLGETSDLTFWLFVSAGGHQSVTLFF